MTRFIVLLWTLTVTSLLSLPAQAEPLISEHDGYAFDQPRLLVQQRLFGIAHGVVLLAATCVRQPEYREALIPAYEQWREQQQATIEQSRLDLAHHYFGARANEAKWADVAQALKLTPALSLKPGSKKLLAACNTFAEALLKPGYDLRQLNLMAARLAAARVIEAKVASCRAMQPDGSRMALDEAMTIWHTTYDARIGEARIMLEQRWPDPQFVRSLDHWLEQPVRRREDAAGAGAIEDAQACETMTTWLLTKQADPDDEPDPNELRQKP